MVLSSRGGLTLDLMNLKFPNSFLATNETSALSGTKPPASAWDSPWKSLECESMVPANTQQSLWLELVTKSPVVEQAMGRSLMAA